MQILLGETDYGQRLHKGVISEIDIEEWDTILMFENWDFIVR